jgi:putative hemolysin
LFPELYLSIAAIFFLMLASIFFSLTETSILSLNKIRLKGHLEKRRKNADIIKDMLNAPENFLAAILIGNNIINITISVLITMIVLGVFGPDAVSLATVIAAFLILAFAEITPKAYAARNPEIAYKLARMMKILIWILRPLIIFFTGITNALLRLLNVQSSHREPIFLRDDLGHLIEMGEEEGVIQQKEKHLLRSALDFSQIRARDVMIPMEKVACIDAGGTLDDAIGVLNTEGFARIPVLSKDRVLGYVHIKDILNNISKRRKSIKDLTRDALFVNPDVSLLELVELIKDRHSSMCFVQDDQGKTQGLITLGLLLEKIIGEIKNVE